MSISLSHEGADGGDRGPIVVGNGNEIAALPEELVTYPAHRVIALLPDVDAAAAAVADLSAAGFERDRITVIVGQAGARRPDVTGRHHELRNRLYRLVWRLGDEYEAFTRTADHLHSGGLAIRVTTDEKRKADAARILRLHGSILTVYFGLLHFEDLGSTSAAQDPDLVVREAPEASQSA